MQPNDCNLSCWPTRAVRSNAGMKSDEASVFCTTSTFATMVKSEVWIKSYGLLKIFKITRVKNAYQIRRTVRCVFEAPRVLETVQYMSRMKALGLQIPKVTLGSEIGSLDQKLWPLEDFQDYA